MADDSLTPEEQAESERRAEQRAALDALNFRIDAELRAARPDRYGEQERAEMVDHVSAIIADLIPATTARDLLAHDLVGRREGQATKRVNKFLRGITGADGQFALPFDWHLFADEPVAILITEVDESGQPIGERRERVTLRAMLPADWINFSSAGRVTAQQRYDAEMRMYAAAEWLAEQQGADSFTKWAEVIAPAPEDAVA